MTQKLEEQEFEKLAAHIEDVKPYWEFENESVLAGALQNLNPSLRRHLCGMAAHGRSSLETAFEGSPNWATKIGRQDAFVARWMPTAIQRMGATKRPDVSPSIATLRPDYNVRDTRQDMTDMNPQADRQQPNGRATITHMTR
ncbi:hypothetical protein [Burkholderia stabilis]|uniref:hypothetical protein n=1 Tax=Burkholderia stabilis TaxID=95485 RepID=UPI001F4AEB9A|nr:hypothetical protein [Burkholderia stabilis]